MSLIIYFLRHGETTDSQKGSYCGTLDPDMTPAGYQMAEDFDEDYKSLPWVAVFSRQEMCLSFLIRPRTELCCAHC